MPDPVRPTDQETRNVTSGGMTHWYYVWDAGGDLVQVKDENVVSGYYAYDGLNRRVESWEGSFLFYAYRGTEALSDRDISGTATGHVYANGLVSTDGNYISRSYYHTDALGSVRLGSDANRNVIFSDGYQPFGQDNGTPTGTMAYRFTGKPASQTTGLYYYYHRWYDPSSGRFVSQDPAQGQLSEPQSLNPYVYTVDRPTSLVDPSGEDECNLLNPFTYRGCINNGVQAANKYVVQPMENYVNKNVVQPLVDNVVKPVINDVVVPIVKNVVIPYIMQMVSFDQTVYNTLSNVGSQMWNGYLSYLQAERNYQTWLSNSVNQDWQSFAHDITHLHVTNWTTFLTGVGFCAGLLALGAAVYFAGPEVAAGEAAAEMATTGAITSAGFTIGLSHVAEGVILLGTGCATLTIGSLSVE